MVKERRAKEKVDGFGEKRHGDVGGKGRIRS